MGNFRDLVQCSVWIHVLFVGFTFCTTVFCSPDLNKMSKSDAALVPDLSDVTWAHAVNSRKNLEEVLAGPLDFIEADVSMGHSTGGGSSIRPVPIMAHPPDRISDISLKDWLELVIQRDTGKGIKLDFKSLDVVKPSLLILQFHKKLNFSLWLNADILNGPAEAKWPPVEGEAFLSICNQYFPNAVLSIGWTTDWQATFLPETWHYEWQQVRKMADTIRCFGYGTNQPKFTFPVRAVFASRSIQQLQWLLSVVPESSLTIWNGGIDPLELEDLIRIRKSFPRDKVYYDVPHSSYKKFLEIKNNISYEMEPSSDFSAEQWSILTRGVATDCSSFTYVGNDSIMFGKSLNTAVLLKNSLLVGDQDSLNFLGRIQFLKDYDPAVPSVDRNQVTLVIIDVDLVSKYVTDDGSVDWTVNDTEVLWSAINSSHLYTFNQVSFDKCHMFKLNSSADLSFQTWTVYCSDMDGKKSFDELTGDAVQQIPFSKRVVLPRVPFVIGFVSEGNGHAVVWDLKIRKSHNSASMVGVSFGVFSLIFLSFIMYGIMT